MDAELVFDNKKFLSSRRAGELAGYTNDYVARLARVGKVAGRMVGRAWYVEEDSFRNFLLQNTSVKEKRKRELREERKREYNEAAAPIALAAPAVQPVSFFSLFFSKRVVGVFAALVIVVGASFAVADYPTTPLTQFFSSHQTLSSENVAEQKAASVLDSIGSLVGDAWRAAFSGLRSLVTTTFSTLSQNEAEPQPGAQTPSLPKEREGVVVVPSSDIGADEDAKKKEIQDAFSDEIAIFPDTDGRAGVIKPIFKTAEAEDYLYVLVPVDETNTENTYE